MNEQQLKEAFIQFLAQKTGAQNQQELEAAIQSMGEQGLQQAYQEFMQLMQQQQVQAAKFGAKLNYIRSLRGQCPEGYKMKYFKSGGQLCKKCMQKQEVSNKDNTPKNAIDEFKCGRKMKAKKKEQGGDIQYNKCGKKMKKKSKKQEGGTFDPKTYSSAVLAKCGAKLKEAACGLKMQKDQKGNKLKKNKPDLATQDSIAANKYNDQEVQTMRPGSYKKNKQGKVQWTPDRTKAPYKVNKKK